MLADPTGYSIDFDVYGGLSQEEKSGKGLAYDVVMDLTSSFLFQGYQVFCDNFYTSSSLFCDLLAGGISVTGTLRTNRQGVLKEVRILKQALERKQVPRGTGFYIRPPNSKTVFVVWKDSKCVVVMSTAHPGHSASTIKRRVKDPVSGHHQVVHVPIPSAVENYNRFMGELINRINLSATTGSYGKQSDIGRQCFTIYWKLSQPIPPSFPTGGEWLQVRRKCHRHSSGTTWCVEGTHQRKVPQSTWSALC